MLAAIFEVRLVGGRQQFAPPYLRHASLTSDTYVTRANVQRLSNNNCGGSGGLSVVRGGFVQNKLRFIKIKHRHPAADCVAFPAL